MNYLRLTALSTLTGCAILAGCGSDVSPPSSSNSAMETTANPILPPLLTPLEKRLKFARVPANVDLSSEAPVGLQEFAAATSGYPAFTPNVPQVQSHGGPTLTNPRIVTVTWDGDVNRDVYEKFGDEIGATTYWRDNTSEYGVGKAVSGAANHVHIAQAITSIADDAIDSLVRDSIKDAAASAASGWPVFDQQTIYNIFLPPNALRFGTVDACGFGIGGYHTDSLLDPTNDHSPAFMYAVNLNCTAKWDVHTITVIASHELVESATDPFPATNTGYVGFDTNHLAYDLFNQFQDEVGDACEFFKSSDYVAGAPFAFGVQRNWSNKSAQAGHDPCVPRTKLPYFNVTTFPEAMDQINVDLTTAGDKVEATAGFLATVGQARTFDIGFYSDAATHGDWTVWTKAPPNLPITDNNGAAIPNGKTSATIDNPSGHNGHKAQVTVTPISFNALGVVYLELHSVLQGAEEKIYPILLSANAATPATPPATPPVTPPATP